MSEIGLPRILWVAARPPVPPLFAGGAIRAQSAISVLGALTAVEVLTFAPREEHAELVERSRRFWSGSPVSLRVIEPGRRVAAFAALRRGRFQSSLGVENPALGVWLDERGWNDPQTLVVLDDIVFAPLLPQYGSNAVISPNDCVSEMFLDHARLSRSPGGALKAWVQHRIALRYEREFYHHALLTHLVTERDRICLQAVNSRARCHVVPYADAGLPSANADASSYTWDVAVWADLGVASSVRGTQAFLAAVAADAQWRGIRLAVVGRVSPADAERLLGRASLRGIEYSRFLEDAEGRMREARVTVVPDVGGTGIKSRCLGLLASGRCVACLYPQMEGIHDICDVGAVNAASPEALVARIRAVLRAGSYAGIAATGHAFYASRFSHEALQRRWADLVRRALTIREEVRLPQALAPPVAGERSARPDEPGSAATEPAEETAAVAHGGAAPLRRRVG